MMNVMRTGWCSYSQKSLLLSVFNSKKDYAFTAFQFCVRMQHKGMIRVSQRYIPVCHTDQRLLLFQPV